MLDDVLVQESLALWDLPPNARIRLINVSENKTYMIESTNHKSILRLHRKGYHTKRAIECELAWMEALRNEQGIETPIAYLGHNGEPIQEVVQDCPRYMVLFHFIDGQAPDEHNTSSMHDGFEELGRLAARCHLHAIAWQRPEPFERLTWDLETIFGKTPLWGDWRDAPEVTKEIQNTLEKVEAKLFERFEAYGKGKQRYNLIHADMRLANLLVTKAGTRLIDFDDCGMGWLMYDFAAAISFIEDDPRIGDFKAAWLKGYRSIRTLALEDELEIDSFIMLRRMALLAWIGSHIEAPEPQKLAKGFAATTAKLGREWLSRCA